MMGSQIQFIFLILFRLRNWVVMALLMATAFQGQGQSLSTWRFFPELGLKFNPFASVTVSSNGDLWINPFGEKELHRFDGYEVSIFENTSISNQPVVETGSGFLWTLYSDGVLCYDPMSKKWSQYPVESIREELKQNLVRQLRPIPTVALSETILWVLFPNRLMRFDRQQSEDSIVLTASGTGLGELIDMRSFREGEIWVGGQRGMARLQGNLLGGLGNDLELNTYFWPMEWQVEKVQQLSLGATESEVTMMGDLALETMNRGLLVWNGEKEEWRLEPLLAKRVRQSWISPEKEIWVQTINELYHYPQSDPNRVQLEPLSMGHLYQVVNEPGGNFWLISSQGVFKRILPTWQKINPFPGDEDMVHRMAQDLMSSNAIWFSTSEKLIQVNGTEVRHWTWPERSIEWRSADAHLIPLMKGQILLVSGEEKMVFDPESGQFTELIDFSNGEKGGWCGLVDDSYAYFWRERPLEELKADEGKYSLWRFDGVLWEQRANFPPEMDDLLAEIRFLIHGDNGDIWFGGDFGLGRISQGQWKMEFSDSSPRKALFFQGLHLGENWFWFCDDRGIWEFREGIWRRISEPFFRITSIVQTPTSGIWVGTSAGVWRYLNGAWIQNGVEEGLPNSVIYHMFQDSQGQLLAATASGVAKWIPRNDVDPPKTLSIDVSPGTRLSTSDNFSVHCVGLDRWRQTLEDRLLYSYKLDFSPWSTYTNANHFVFNELAPGKHTLGIRAMDRNGNEGSHDHIKWVEFLVQVPWYQEPRIMSVTILGALAAIFFASLAVSQHLQLVRSYAQVEKMVEERTRQLEKANLELLHSQKMKAVGSLAAGVAHDFNSILSIIKGSVQIMASHPQDESKIRTRIQRILTAVDQGASLVRAMLGLSRVRPDQIGSCSVNDQAERTVKLLDDRYHQKAVLHLDLTDDLPQIMGEPEIVLQMILNLVINAVEAMPEGKEVTIQTCIIDTLLPHHVLAPSTPPPWVGVYIIDQGHGIAPENVERIFEPFFTTKSLSTHRGTGLGLWMVFQFAKELGYGISLASELGQGTTFCIALPPLPNRSC